jgi:hypothetical protein
MPQQGAKKEKTTKFTVPKPAENYSGSSSE